MAKKDRNQENLVYSIEVELYGKPLIITTRVGKDFIDATVTDKKTGEMMEYVAQKGDKIEAIKRHNMSASDIKKMMEAKS